MYNTCYSLILFLLLLCIVHGWGEGPIGIYSIDSQAALVCDSDRGAIFLVDIRTGGTKAKFSMVEYWKTRMVFHPHNRTGAVPHLVGVASCSSCRYFIATFHTMVFEGGVSSTGGEHILRFELERPLAEWRDGNIGLENATVVDWPLPEEQNIKLRMITLNEAGTRAYLANFKGSILSFDPLFLPGNTKSQQFEEIARLGQARSVQLTERSSDVLLATGHGGVMFINLSTGVTCALDKKFPNPRDGVMDPTREDTMILFAEDTLYSVFGVQRFCEDGSPITWKKEGSGKRGWLDDGEKGIYFARPHNMRLVPSAASSGAPTELLLTDIDNGVLRLVQLEPERWRSSTVIYDHTYDRLASTYDSHAHYATPLAASSYYRKPIGEASSWTDAKAKCEAVGARLCTAFEAGIGYGGEEETGGNLLSNLFVDAAWTSYACHSCWHPYPGWCTGRKMKTNQNSWENGHMTARALVTPDGALHIENRCVPDSENNTVVCCSELTGLSPTRADSRVKSTLILPATSDVRNPEIPSQHLVVLCLVAVLVLVVHATKRDCAIRRRS